MAFDVQGLVKGLIAEDSFLTQIVVYNAVGQILQPLLAPYVQRLLNDSQSATQNVPLSPADLSDMVVRGVMDEGAALSQALKAGVDKDDFHKLVLNTGEPPGVEQVIGWYLRGLLPWEDGGVEVPSVERAIKTSRMKNYWADTIREGIWQPLTVADAVNAWIRYQIDEGTALNNLKANGINGTNARILYNTAGRPPAPGELANFIRRGLIPLRGTGPDVLSFQQGIAESDLKNKWEPILENLVIHYPSAFQIRQMQGNGAINAAEAYKLYKLEGFPDDVAQSATAAGSVSKTAKAKELTESTVAKLYEDQIINRADALADLAKIGYTAPEAALILSTIDYAQAARAITAAVTAIRTQYVHHKLTEAIAKELLAELGLTPDRIDALLATWNTEAKSEVRVLTEAQVVDAVVHGIATEDWAIGELETMGYSAVDAWVLLSVKLKNRLPNPPEGAPAAPPTATAAP